MMVGYNTHIGSDVIRLVGITAFRDIHWQHYPYRAFGIGVCGCITIATTTREALCLIAG
jgi:hypothetical protein